MPFAIVHRVCLGQRILELPDAVGQDPNLVMKHFGVCENEAAARLLTCRSGNFHDKKRKRRTGFPCQWSGTLGLAL
jgi:hypothetical protein